MEVFPALNTGGTWNLLDNFAVPLKAVHELEILDKLSTAIEG